LYGAAGIADNPAITRLLLERGADPNDDESLYHSAEHDDLACLRLLVEHGAREPGTNALANILHRDSVEGVRLLLSAGADPGRPQPDGPPCAGLLADLSIAALPAAADRCSAAVVEELLAEGADPDARCRDGRSPIRAAVRRGRFDVAEVLLRHGARDDVTDVDRFLGACARADRAAAERLLETRPGLVAELTDDDRAAIVDAADYVGTAAVRLMLDLGFPVDAQRASDGAEALHAAAYTGRADLVRLLIARGADVNARDGRWRSTPLLWATVGSGERPRYSPYGDWVITVEALFEAGAVPDGAWVDGKPPSEEVAALLYARGVIGDEVHET
jgi:ankyrin repeat protein